MTKRIEGGAVGPAAIPGRKPQCHADLGLRIETVSRQLRRLSAAGVIETTSRRLVTVRDLAALERIVESGLRPEAGER